MQRRKLRARSGRRRSRRRSCASSRVVRLASFVSTVRTHREAPPRSPPSFFSSRRRPAASPSVPAPAARPTPRRARTFERAAAREAPRRRSLTLGERKSANAHLSLASSFSAVSTPANGAGCRVKSANALSRSLSHESTGGAEQRSGALLAETRRVRRRLERVRARRETFGIRTGIRRRVGIRLVSDGVPEGSHVSATALRRSSRAAFSPYGDPGYVDAKSARTSHLVHAAHRSPLSSAASASSDDAARAPRTVAPYRPRPSSGSDPGRSRAAARLSRGRRAPTVAARWHPFLIRDRSLRSMDESPFRNRPGSRREDTRGAPFEVTRVRDRPEGARAAPVETRQLQRVHSRARILTHDGAFEETPGNLVRRGRTRRGPEPAAAETATETRAKIRRRRRAPCRASRAEHRDQSRASSRAQRRRRGGRIGEVETDDALEGILRFATLRRVFGAVVRLVLAVVRLATRRRRRLGRVPEEERRWTRRLV